MTPDVSCARLGDAALARQLEARPRVEVGRVPEHRSGHALDDGLAAHRKPSVVAMMSCGWPPFRALARTHVRPSVEVHSRPAPSGTIPTATQPRATRPRRARCACGRSAAASPRSRSVPSDGVPRRRTRRHGGILVEVLAHHHDRSVGAVATPYANEFGEARAVRHRHDARRGGSEGAGWARRRPARADGDWPLAGATPRTTVAAMNIAATGAGPNHVDLPRPVAPCGRVPWPGRSRLHECQASAFALAASNSAWVMAPESLERDQLGDLVRDGRVSGGRLRRAAPLPAAAARPRWPPAAARTRPSPRGPAPSRAG